MVIRLIALIVLLAVPARASWFETWAASGPAAGASADLTLFAQWTFDSVSGGLIPDVSGNGHSLSNYACTISSGYAAIDAASRSVRTVETNLLNGAAEWTLTMWFNRQNLVALPSPFGSAAGSFNMGLVSVSANWRLYSGWNTASANAAAPTTTNQWLFIAATFKDNGTGNVDVLNWYVDGALKATSTQNVTNFNNQGQMWYSGFTLGAGQLTWVDDIRLYSVAKSTNELTAIMSGGRQ